MHYDGSPIFIGREDGALTVTAMGDKKGPHLLVAEESGRIIYYDRKRTSCDSFNKYVPKTCPLFTISYETNMRYSFIRFPEGKGQITDVDGPLTVDNMLDEMEEEDDSDSDDDSGKQSDVVLSIIKEVRIPSVNVVSRKLLRVHCFWE
mgnify:CR=1 FL=1